MKTLPLLALVLLAPLCHADDAAIAIAKDHLKSTLTRDFKVLGKTYAPKVTLMPGHEFLKPEYGLAEAGDRSKAVELKRGKLIAAMKKDVAGQPARPLERVEEKLKTLRYEPLEIAEGDFATAPSDSVKTPDGKLHFAIKKGDVLLKVSPPRGDFVLLHLRKGDGGWQVVSEYLD